MSVFVNTSKSLLVMAGGESIEPGKAGTISKDMLENGAVKTWIASGMLVTEKDYKEPPTIASMAEVTADRDALLEKIAAMQADLDAATAPKK